MTLTKEALSPYILALVGSEELAELWWTSPNRAFNLATPESVDLELVKDYLLWHSFAANGS